MGRIGSQCPEVVHGLDQPSSKMPTPDSIHDHSGKKEDSHRMQSIWQVATFRFRFPPGISFSPTGKRFRNPRILKIAFQVRIATQKNMQFRYVALFDAQ